MFDRDKVLRNQMMLDEIMIMGGRELVVDLIVFKMLNFGMFLVMDVFSKYDAEIDCRKNTAVLKGQLAWAYMGALVSFPYVYVFGCLAYVWICYIIFWIGELMFVFI